jgi:hypothetical protein
MRLEHPQFGTSRLDADASECDHIARQEAFRATAFSGLQPRFVRGRDGRLYQVRPSFHELEMERWHAERNLSDYCLRSRGYRLVPVPQ